ncbi:MAG: T9SS type A sorting domain-containing protein [Bacteroidia bacterium]
MINTSGIITTIAGAGNSTGDGGAATLASLGDPIGLAFDALGNLYISDYAYHKIRKVTTTGIISTIAGNGTGGGSGDGGAATAALLNGPTDICFDKAGNLYITENAGSKIRMIDTLGIITTIGKNIGPNLLGDGGQINAASIYSPYALAFDKQGNLYFSEVGRKKIRKVSGCNTSISVSVTGNTNICKGISTTLTASGATSYIWSNNDSTATITLSPTASKTLTVIGLTGLCVSSASVVITVSPHLVVTGTSTLCPGSTATLTATGATSYTWSANAGNASGSSVTLNPINTSTYSVIGFDGTCTDTVFHTVNVIGINVANGYPGNINNPSNDSVCAPGNHDLYAQNCATYTWSPNAGGGHSYTAIVSPTVTTTYSVTGVLSACSLLVTDTITLYVTNSPTLSIVSNKPDTVCSGTNILLTASGASTYNWTMAYSNLTDSTSTFSTNITYPTTFTVTGSVNGCYSQTTYNVFAPTVYIYSNANFCLGNTATLHAGGMNTYTWSVNAGGTTSDSAVIAPTTNTTFYVKGTDNATSCQDSSSITINIVTGCVWPGDANEDLVVDNLDLLSVGLEYNHHYVQRNQLGNLWQGYNCSTWYDTLSNGKDIKYADCNGDGTINMNDTLPINLNYGLTHLARTSSPSTVQNTHPDMYITFNKPSYYPGDTVFSNILIGDITNVQNNFYGAAFTINYDNTQVKPNSERFYFNNSWVGNINQTKIKFSKVDANTGTVNASLVRTTHTDISGYGQVATLQFILKDTLNVNQLYFTIHNGIKTDYLGTYSNLNTGTDSAAILSITSVNSIKNNNSIAIYPNPTNSIFYLKTNTILENALIEVYDIMGRKVMIEKVQGNVTAINLNTLNNAIYQIRLLNNNALIYQGKIVKQQ